ncbi:MAG: hypothetical protein CTY12_01285 [Methylotenera sp.]|nr:MAG: hypothetical protein CTY12_01285 [Methylotenera sp.]
MLLIEIATASAPQNYSADRINYMFNINQRYKQLGFPGHQATAFSHKNKSNVVVKTIKLKHKDPIIDFIEICQQHSDNPFLPKVYSAKIYKRENDSYMIVTMEKLHPVRGPNTLIKNNLPFFINLRILPSDEDKQHPLYNQLNKPTGMSVYELIRTMFADTEYRHWLTKNTPNSKLAEALTLLENLFETHFPDLHIDNFMIRLSGSTPQLVLLDPIIG